MIEADSQLALLDRIPDALRPDQCLCQRRVFGAQQLRHDAWDRLRGDQGTIAGWIRPSNNPIDGAQHPYFGLAPINANPISIIGLIKNAFNTVGILVRVGALQGAFTPAAALTANNWHLICGIWNPATASFYLDGTLRVTAALAAGSGDQTLPAAAQIGVGVLPANVSAEIGNCMFWGRELGPEEIAQMWTDRVGF